MGPRPRAQSSRLGLHLAVLAVLLPKALATAVPAVSASGLESIRVVNRIGAFSLTVSNQGDTVGYLPFVDIGEAPPPAQQHRRADAETPRVCFVRSRATAPWRERRFGVAAPSRGWTTSLPMQGQERTGLRWPLAGGAVDCGRSP